MAASNVRAVARGGLLEQLHVAQQPRSYVAAFEQVMAENPFLREPLRESPLERIHLVDPFADERALGEQILVDIRYGARIGVDTGFGRRSHSRVARAPATRGRGHAGLQDPIAVYHAPGNLVIAGAIQRVGHGSNELASRIARKLRIAVERDHVLDVAKDRRVTQDE